MIDQLEKALSIIAAVQDEQDGANYWALELARVELESVIKPFDGVPDEHIDAFTNGFFSTVTEFKAQNELAEIKKMFASGSVEAIKALVALLNESLNNAPPEPILEVEL